ncbi:MAG: hypothetical protein KC455_12060 [Carnobacterium sp.]|nr:hypothetical protein [Carnobacterium sp.]
MILPNKYITVTESLIGLSALILDVLSEQTITIDILWKKFQSKYDESNLNSLPTFQKFIWTVDFMYISSMINYSEQGEVYNENIKFKNNFSSQ